MELLLTIAILIIVVVSTIPYFMSGSKGILEDAKKTNMSTSYQSARTGANLLISIVTAKAKTISGNLDNLEQNEDIKNLENYSPISSRIFEGKNGKKFVFGARVEKNALGRYICLITYVEGEDPTKEGTQVAEPDATDYIVNEALDNLWETVFAGEPQQ